MPQSAVAIPAGFEPATHGLEIRRGIKDFSDLPDPCCNGAAFSYPQTAGTQKMPNEARPQP
jgi:hypothetical protein